jgi:hypothetical protein
MMTGCGRGSAMHGGEAAVVVALLVARLLARRRHGTVRLLVLLTAFSREG